MSILHDQNQWLSCHAVTVFDTESPNMWQDGAEKNLVIILARGKRFLFVESQLDESGGLTSHAHAGTHNIFKEVFCLSQLQNRHPGKHYIIPSWPADIYSCRQRAHNAGIFFFFWPLNEWHQSGLVCCCVHCKMDFITFNWSEGSRSALHIKALLMGQSELAEHKAVYIY